MSKEKRRVRSATSSAVATDDMVVVVVEADCTLDEHFRLRLQAAKDLEVSFEKKRKEMRVSLGIQGSKTISKNRKIRI